MKKFLTLLSTYIFVSAAYAECNPDFCAHVYIERLIPLYTGKVLVGTSGDEKLLNCQAGSGELLTLSADHAGSDKIYSTLLAAQLSGKEVNSIQVQDNSEGCIIEYITLDKQ